MCGKALVKSCEFKEDKPGATALTGSRVGDESTDVQVIHNNKLEILDSNIYYHLNIYCFSVISEWMIKIMKLFYFGSTFIRYYYYFR